MAIVHHHAIEDANKVLNLTNSISERLGQAYVLLKNTGAKVDIQPFMRLDAMLGDVRDEAHKVVLAAINEGVV